MLQKRAKCHPNGVKMAIIFFEKLQQLPSSWEPQFQALQSTELGVSKKHRRAQAQILQQNYFVYFKMQTEIPQPNIVKLKAQAQIPQP